MVQITGWGRGVWSEGAFGEAAPVLVSGVSAAGEVGTAFVATSQTVFLSGVAASAQAGALREIVRVTGAEAGAETSRVLVWGKEIPDPGTVWTEIAA